MDGRLLSIFVLLMRTCETCLHCLCSLLVSVHFISAQPAENDKQIVGGIYSGHDIPGQGLASARHQRRWPFRAWRRRREGPRLVCVGYYLCTMSIWTHSDLILVVKVYGCDPFLVVIPSMFFGVVAYLLAPQRLIIPRFSAFLSVRDPSSEAAY